MKEDDISSVLKSLRPIYQMLVEEENNAQPGENNSVITDRTEKIKNVSKIIGRLMLLLKMHEQGK